MDITPKPETAPRAERLGFRVDEDTKALIERAAALEHRKVSDFCTSALREAAQRTIERQQFLVLSARDQEVFFDVLMNPPPINERLRRAIEAHKVRVIDTSKA